MFYKRERDGSPRGGEEVGKARVPADSSTAGRQAPGGGGAVSVRGQDGPCPPRSEQAGGRDEGGPGTNWHGRGRVPAGEELPKPVLEKWKKRTGRGYRRWSPSVHLGRMQTRQPIACDGPGASPRERAEPEAEGEVSGLVLCRVALGLHWLWLGCV